MANTELVFSKEAIEGAIRFLLPFEGWSKIWFFDAEMGGGKTTLISAICEYFQVVDAVSSPTFSLVNEYQNAGGKRFYHFDFYRMVNEQEALDIGVDDYFYSGDLCFIEWPSRIRSLWPVKYVHIQIIVTGPTERKLVVKKHG